MYAPSIWGILVVALFAVLLWSVLRALTKSRRP